MTSDISVAEQVDLAKTLFLPQQKSTYFCYQIGTTVR